LNYVNGFKVERCLLGRCNAYNNSYSKYSNDKKNSDKTPYELWKGRPVNVKHFRAFGNKCYIKRDYGRMGKFDSHVDKGIVVGYSSTRNTYKCFNLRLNKVVETINVMVDEKSG
jgi:hypothetical protein